VELADLVHALIRRLLRDPLTHFLAAGAALFALSALVSDDSDGRRDRIVVTEAQVASLAEKFERTWLRPPTAEELRGLVDEHVTEEILYREALALGLDRDDLVVRRRMRQKMEFLSAELTAADPSEQELAAFVSEHAERFALPARWSFAQIFFSPERAGEPRATALLRELRARPAAPADPASLGDATLLPAALERATAREVSDRFGAPFADALAAAPEREWHGPVASAFGLHLVRVDRYEPARAPALEEVREIAVREWADQHRDEQQQRFYRALRAGYQIDLPDLPELPAGPAATAATAP
jgi:hypothetical protein